MLSDHVKDIRKEKYQLELRIHAAIQREISEFRKNTGLIVRDVSVNQHRVEFIGMPDEYPIKRIDVTLDI